LNKRTLMLSAAAVAVMSAPALAVGPTTISTVVTTPQKTSATGDLTITSAGGITLTSATDPLVTLDSSNAVDIEGTLTGTGVSNITAMLIDGTKNATGSLLANGVVNLTGTGTGKTVLHLSGTGSFTGPISFGTRAVNVTGDQSVGIAMDSGFVLNGNLTLGSPTFSLRPTKANDTSSSSSITIASLAGTINGNLSIVVNSQFTAVGNDANGISIAGPLNGTFTNAGALSVAGVENRSTTQPNAESGFALDVSNSITGGILNDGPSPISTAPAALISSNGVGANATILIQPTTTAITIGKVTDANTLNAASFINRGSITAQAENANESVTRAIVISGTSTSVTNFIGTFFNSGTISAQAQSTSTGTSITATALQIDSYVNIPELHFSGQSASANSSLGAIFAATTGPTNQIAQAIILAGSPIGGSNVSSIPTITIDAGAQVVASATVTDPSAVAVTNVQATAILDLSNSLTTLNNAGTISATATPLTNGNTSRARAVDVSLNLVGLNFTNTGHVNGDVLFGQGNDTYTVQGTIAIPAAHTGAIDFGLAGTDQLNVGQYANVAGVITGQGTLGVDIANHGMLSVQNVATTLQANTFHVSGDPNPNVAGTVNINVSLALASAGVISAATSATLDPGANLNVHYGSFIPSGGTFVLISAPTGALNVAPADIIRYNSSVSGASLPFLFDSATIQRVNNVAGRDSLQLTVITKTLGTDPVHQLNLTGYAVQLFPVANEALVGDDALGAAMIAGINSLAQAQSAYDAFAPDVSGGTRAVAISLTDQATGVVAARQRQLRLFSRSPGELTLWGNEFGEYISTHGQTVTGVEGVTLSPGACVPGCPTVDLNGFKDRGFGFSIGLDSGAPELGWYGAAFTFYTGDIAEGGDRNSRSNTLWYLLTGYTDWRGRGLFFDSQVTVGVGQIKGKRVLELTIPASGAIAASIFRREADSKRAGLVGALGFTTGAMMRYGSTVITPQLAIDGMSLREEGFTEVNGGSGFDLAVKPSYANSLRAFLGTEIRQDLNLGDFLLQPSARVGYRFDFLNDPVKAHASFADINSVLSGNQPGTPFTLRGPDPGRGNVVGGLNLNATTDNWTIGVSYDFVRGSNNSTEQVGTFSLLGRI